MDSNSSYYKNLINKHSNNPSYIKDTKKYINKLSEQSLPIVFDKYHFSLLTNNNIYFIRKIIKRDFNDELYRIFYIKKRNGSKRRIAVPENNLKSLQDWIKKNILDKISPHSCSKAYSCGCTIYKNAEIHCDKKYLIKLDLHNFFESISERKVYKFFKSLGYTNDISFTFTRICTYPLKLRKKNKSSKWSSERLYNLSSSLRNYNGDFIIGSLLQGTSVSPPLSNLCFFNTDKIINTLCIEYNCEYTRYSDDISISSNFLDREKAIDLIKKITIILNKSGYRINNKKTILAPPGAKKIVTGLIVNNTKPGIPKKIYNELKNCFYYCKKYGAVNSCKRIGFKTVSGYHNHIKGLLNYIKSINIEKYNLLIEKFKKIQWPDI